MQDFTVQYNLTLSNVKLGKIQNLTQKNLTYRCKVDESDGLCLTMCDIKGF